MPVAFAGARPPGPQPLVGRHVRLERVEVAAHAAALWQAAQGPGADPDLWRFMPYGPFSDLEAMSSYVAAWEGGTDPVAYAIVPAATGRASGIATYLRITPEHGTTEIGHIWLGAGLQRTPAATEAISLLAAEAFDGLGNRRLEWKCNAANSRSRRAAERFGFTYEGTFRRHQVVKGRNRDTAWYAITDDEWPRVRDGFARWLDPGNFDEAGRQRARLEELRAS